MDILNKEELGLLCKVGFMACASGKVNEGREIFESLQIALPESVGPQIGMAFSYMIVDNFEKCDSTLKEILEKDELNYDAKGLLALSLALQKKDDEVRELVATLKEDCGTGYALAQSALEFVNNRIG